MSEGSDPGDGKRSRWVLPSLLLSTFATYPSSVISTLLLEIGLTFNQPVGVMAQMRTLGSVVGFLSALVIGVDHLRYVQEHRLIRRSVTLLSIIGLLAIALVVWIYGLG